MLPFLVPRKIRPRLLEPEALSALRKAILESPYLAASDLNSGFQGTYGFSILFQRSQLRRVVLTIPPLAPFLERVLEPRASVFFLNPLVIHQGNGVAPHADKTLGSFLPEGSCAPFPHRVSVLYLNVPPDLDGGDLIFHRNALVRARVRPVENMLVEFPGWLHHEVTPYQQARSQQPRVSLVCEQYRVSAAVQSQIPDFFMDTTRDFADFLDKNAGEICPPAESEREQTCRQTLA